MMGLLYFLAASRQALTVEEEVQLTAAAVGGRVPYEEFGEGARAR